MRIDHIVNDLARLGTKAWGVEAHAAWTAAMARISPIDRICLGLRAAMTVPPSRFSARARRALIAACETVETYHFHGMGADAAAFRTAISSPAAGSGEVP